MSDGFPQRVAHLFGRVLTAAPAERAALLAAHREREPDVVRRVEWMLADRESETPTRVVNAAPAAAGDHPPGAAADAAPVAPASHRCDIAAGDETTASDDDGNPAPRRDAPDAPPLLDAGAAPGANRDAAARSGVFPGYEIVRRLSQGGQGVVYQAVETATKRKVALKVLLEGVHASKSARRRFEREIEIVAQFRHPHIISVLHAGQSGDGRQFYAMDYVRGEPLTTFVRSKKLPLDAALELFATLCDAVQYAHQRGIIHRDLKPSNVLVDTEGRLRVLDFGLAKSLGATDHTLISLTGQAVGTLAYMSPEQTRGNPDEIDTRADVYALGVILYELLVGQYPYPVTGSIAEILNHIASTPPTPPSRNWKADSGVAGRASSRAGRCPIDADLETIVLKALSKERERRYPGAGDLARDVRHYLASEPIEARRDSALYVLRKTLGRYRLAAGVAAAFVVMAVGFGVVMGVQARQVAGQRDRARDAESLALAERDRAESERGRAQAQWERAETGLADATRALRRQWMLRRDAATSSQMELERRRKEVMNRVIPRVMVSESTLLDALTQLTSVLGLEFSIVGRGATLIVESRSTESRVSGVTVESSLVSLELENATVERILREVLRTADGGRDVLVFSFMERTLDVMIGERDYVARVARASATFHPDFHGSAEVFRGVDENPALRLALLEQAPVRFKYPAVQLGYMATRVAESTGVSVSCDWDELRAIGVGPEIRLPTNATSMLGVFDSIARTVEAPPELLAWSIDADGIVISSRDALTRRIEGRPTARAATLVDELEKELMSKTKVKAAIEARTDLPAEVRDLALWTADGLSDRPYYFSEQLLAELKRPDLAQEQRLVLRQKLELLASNYPTHSHLKLDVARAHLLMGADVEAQAILEQMPGKVLPDTLWPYHALAAFHSGRREEAEDLIERIFASSRAWGKVTSDPAGTQDWSDEVATLVLGQAAAEQRRRDYAQALPMVERLFEELCGLDDVRAAIAAEASLSDARRSAALRIADKFPRAASGLNAKSWHVVSRPGDTPARYARALRLAREAVRQEPQEGLYIRTLGAAFYRSDSRAEALDALRRSDALNSGGDPEKRRPRDVVFLAMTLWCLGCPDEAWTEFDALCRLMALPHHAADADAQRLFDEAAELIAGSAAESR